MTEAGKQWLKEATGEVSFFDISESAYRLASQDLAEFWIISFCMEVQKSADDEWERQTQEGADPSNRQTECELIAYAFARIKLKLLG